MPKGASSSDAEVNTDGAMDLHSRFVLLWLDPYYCQEPQQVYINEVGLVSVDHGPWHGNSVFGGPCPQAMFWHLAMNVETNANKPRRSYTFKRIPCTDVFIHTEEESSWNCILIALPQRWEDYFHRMVARCNAPR